MGERAGALLRLNGHVEAEEALDDASLRTFFASDVKARRGAAIGLQYGPGYCTLTQAWGGEATR